MDSRFSQISRMEVFLKKDNSLKPLFISVTSPIQDILLSWMNPRYYFKCSRPEVFLGKAVLKICCKFTGEHPCRSVISSVITLLCNFIEIRLWYGYSPVNLLYIFTTPFPKNTSGRLLLNSFSKHNCIVSLVDFLD